MKLYINILQKILFNSKAQWHLETANEKNVSLVVWWPCGHLFYILKKLLLKTCLVAGPYISFVVVVW